VPVQHRETKRLLLEPWEGRHRAAWRAICRVPEVMRFVGRGELWDEVKADAVFDRMLAHWREHGFGWRSTLNRTTGEWLGFVGLSFVGPGVETVDPEHVEIGWWIVPSAWGRGYASEAAAAARDEGFAVLGLAHMLARLQPANLASARVAEKIGMCAERQAIGRSGEEIVIYGLGREAWDHRDRGCEQDHV
jgi:ribosomal-protein-alanine N-acetyltransferase